MANMAVLAKPWPVVGLSGPKGGWAVKPRGRQSCDKFVTFLTFLTFLTWRVLAVLTRSCSFSSFDSFDNPDREREPFLGKVTKLLVRKPAMTPQRWHHCWPVMTPLLSKLTFLIKTRCNPYVSVLQHCTFVKTVKLTPQLWHWHHNCDTSTTLRHHNCDISDIFGNFHKFIDFPGLPGWEAGFSQDVVSENG